MTLTEARDVVDTFEPGTIITPADYPRLARCFVTLRDNGLPALQHRLVNAALRDLYRYCELTGQDWSDWTC